MKTLCSIGGFDLWCPVCGSYGFVYVRMQRLEALDHFLDQKIVGESKSYVVQVSESDNRAIIVFPEC
jgi:hypothetical protein